MKFEKLQTKTIAMQYELKPVGNTKYTIREEINAAQKQEELKPVVYSVIDDFYKDLINQWLTNTTLSYRMCDEMYDIYKRILIEPAAKDEYIKYSDKIKDTLIADLKNVTYCGVNSSVSSSKLFGTPLMEYVETKDYDSQSKEYICSLVGGGSFYDRYIKTRSRLFEKDSEHNTVISRVLENMYIYFANCVLVEQYVSQSILNSENAAHFAANRYADTLTQDCIDSYNVQVGIINQTLNEAKLENRPKMLKALKKQLLFDTGKAFTFPVVTNDEEFIKLTEDTYATAYNVSKEFSAKCVDLFTKKNLENYEINTTNLGSISTNVYGRYDVIFAAQNNYLDSIEGKTEKAKEKARKTYKARKFVTVSELVSMLEALVAEDENYKDIDPYKIYSYYRYACDEYVRKIAVSYNAISSMLRSGIIDKNRGAELKAFFDAAIEGFGVYKDLKNTDITNPIYDILSDFEAKSSDIISNYHTARNYITKKGKDLKSKIPMQFGYSNFGVGDSRYISKSGSFLYKDGNNVYLAIPVKGSKFSLDNMYASDDEESIDMLYWNQLTDIYRQLPRIIFSKSGMNTYKPSDEIMYIKSTEGFKTNKEMLTKWCSFLIDCLSQNPDYAQYDVKNRMRAAEEYENISEFYNELEFATYSIEVKKLSKDKIHKLNEEGLIYIFQIYCKDFSPAHHGKTDRNTALLLSLFDNNNSKNCIELNPHTRIKGGLSVFYREPKISLSDTTIHKAGQPIALKNPINAGKSKTFKYDIIKNRRYTQEKLLVSILITTNNVIDNTHTSYRFNKEVNKDVINKNILAITRGNKHLISYMITKPDGTPIEKGNFDKIVSNTATSDKYEFDYNALLSKAEAEYLDNQKKWKPVKGIDDTKKGYLSAVLSKIVQLQQKYDCIIAVEKLNAGGSRDAVITKKLYKGFEEAIIKKFNYVETSEGIKQYTYLDNIPLDKMWQNGIIYLTGTTFLRSKYGSYIDRISHLFKFKNATQAKDLLNSFRRFYYDNEAFYVEFSPSDFIPKDNIPVTSDIYTIKLQGIVRTFIPDKNGHTKLVEYDLVASIKDILETDAVEYESGANIQLDALEATGFKQLVDILRIALKFETYNPVKEENYTNNLLYTINGVEIVKTPEMSITDLRLTNMIDRLKCNLTTINADGIVDNQQAFDKWIGAS